MAKRAKLFLALLGAAGMTFWMVSAFRSSSISMNSQGIHPPAPEELGRVLPGSPSPEIKKAAAASSVQGPARVIPNRLDPPPAEVKRIEKEGSIVY